jgi:hypothetical protein
MVRVRNYPQEGLTYSFVGLNYPYAIVVFFIALFVRKFYTLLWSPVNILLN